MKNFNVYFDKNDVNFFLECDDNYKSFDFYFEKNDNKKTSFFKRCSIAFKNIFNKQDTYKYTFKNIGQLEKFIINLNKAFNDEIKKERVSGNNKKINLRISKNSKIFPFKGKN